jgi:hypothetical protein
VALAAVSIVQQALLTVTDALNPLGVGSHAWVNRPGEWKDKLLGNSLVWRYAAPLFVQGTPRALVGEKFNEWLDLQRRKLEKEIADPAGRAARLEAVRAEAWAKVSRGDQEPVWIAAMPGPVSVNVIGPWDGAYFQNFPAHSRQARWAAFNVGELIWPESRWSICPLLAMWIAGAIGMRRWLRDSEKADAA